VFPGVPDSWPDVTIDKMRTEGAFLVSAVRRGGKTQWVRIESLAGEPCRLKCDLDDFSVITNTNRNVIAKRANDLIEIDLKKGEAVMLVSKSAKGDFAIEPVAAQPDQLNSFGVR
jgi:hypothetical protein